MRPALQQVLIQHSNEVQLEDAVVSKDFVAVFTRRGGLQVTLLHPTAAGANSCPCSRILRWTGHPTHGVCTDAPSARWYGPAPEWTIGEVLKIADR